MNAKGRLVRALAGAALGIVGCGGDSVSATASGGDSSGDPTNASDPGSSGAADDTSSGGPPAADEEGGATLEDGTTGGSTSTGIDSVSTGPSTETGSTGSPGSSGEDSSSGEPPDECEVPDVPHVETIIDVAETHRAGSAAVADFNGDGHLDVVTGGAADGDDLVLYFGDGTGDLEFEASFGATQRMDYLLAGDVDGDGDTDIISHGGLDNQTVWVNDGAGSFEGNPGPAYQFAIDMVGGDFDGDGLFDAVVVPHPNDVPVGESMFEIFLSDGAGGLTINEAFHTDTEPGSLVRVADFDGDAVLDIFTQNGDLYLGDGSGNFAATGNFNVGTGSHGGLDAADLDEDGDADVALVDLQLFGATSLVELINDGAGDLGLPSLTAGFSTSMTELMITDANGDGLADVVIAQINLFAAGNILFYRRDACGEWEAAVGITIGNGGGGFYPLHIARGDLDEDGIDDIVSPNGGDNTLSILLSAR